MKIAIFHNFLDNIGGAEKVTLTLAKELRADVYSTNIDYDKIKKMGFENINLKSIGHIPINPPWRQQLALYKFRKLNLKNKYDFYIICGDWAVSAAVNHSPNLWYAHTPLGEIFHLYKHTRENIVPWYKRPFFDIWVKHNRRLIKKYIQSVNAFVCNSKNTQARIKKYLNQDAQVIYPPIETSKFYYGQNKNYWLSVNRLIKHKQIDLQLEAFRKMPDEKLIIVGSYEQARHFKNYLNHLQKIKPANVSILSWVDNQELIDLYANCKGFITTTLDEDFGMTPVEALAAGKPVIAPNQGGHKETLNALTGKLIDDMDVNKIVQAVKEIGKNPGKYKENCIRQAKKFDTQIFIKKIKGIIKSGKSTS